MTENEIIAEFMDGEMYGNGGSVGRIWRFADRDEDYEDLKYYTSWSELMPVWAKFRDLKLSERDTDQHSQWISSIGRTILFGSCNEACLHLTEGIKWYNQTKQK